MGPPTISEEEGLRAEVATLTKINTVLMRRVESSMGRGSGAYSLFQTAVALEGQVRERTKELENALARLEQINDELATARDEAERANRFKTRLFSAVGHDLLQPLHAAQLTVSALVAPLITTHEHQLFAIRHALSTIEELLKSILDISKLEAGAIMPTRQSVLLDELFASLVANMEPLAQAKLLSLSWRRSCFCVFSDPLLLRRILQNLLANAVQYTHQGGIKLLARRRGDDVRIEVWDTGPGIPGAEQEMIFREFERGPATDPQPSSGFGLGLSIVQHMTRILGHPVDLCSKIGRGTRFSVTVPFAEKLDGVALTLGERSRRTYGLAGSKVLMIDSDAEILEAVQALLESWSCETRAVRSLAQFEAVIGEQSFQPDLLLADYNLDHGECGLTAVERLRAMTGSSIPSVIIAAERSASIAQQTRGYRCEILLKPVKPAELRALMAHLLAQPKPADSSADSRGN